MDLEKYYKFFEKEIREQFVKSVANAMAKDDGRGFNRGDKIRDRSGALADSFGKDAKVKNRKGRLEVIFGSDLPYASIQEEGGFIRSKGKMQWYFLHKFEKTKELRYKIIGLSVIKKGGVQIKARPYINEAIDNFEESSEEIWEKLAIKVINDFIDNLNERNV